MARIHKEENRSTFPRESVKPDCQIVTNVVEHIDYKVKQLHNRNKYFVQMRLEHLHLVQKCKHQHVVSVEVVPFGMGMDYIDNLVVVEDRTLVVVVVVVAVALVDIEYLNLPHIPMEHISHSILPVELQQQNLFHNLVHYTSDDHSLDLNEKRMHYFSIKSSFFHGIPLGTCRLTNRLTNFVSRRFNWRDDDASNLIPQATEMVVHNTINTNRSFILKVK